MAGNQDLKTQKKLKKKRRKELFAYFREVTRKEGFFAAIRRTLRYMKRRRVKKGRFLPSIEAQQSQRRADVRGWPKVSVLVPAFDPDPTFFSQLLGSVKNQTYENWELCIVNAGENKETVAGLVASRFGEDERVMCEEMENAGISENTNRAARMATGEWLVFLDHDDVLSPDALFEVAQRAVARPEAGFIYSDEALFETDILTPTVGHFKPDYSPQYLLNVNYIAHLAAVKKEIFLKVGGFHSAYDGAQDHDLYLRALEETGGAEHIRRVLYYWRQHAGSTSTGMEAKPYAAEAGQKAIADHLERINVRGTVVDGMFPGTHKVNYALKGLPLVSVIIPSCEHVADLDRCLQSLYTKTSYRRFEVLVVENNSQTVETFAYYQKITELYPNLRVLVYEGDKSFNFAKVCNFGRGEATGHYLLFLNNDTEAINPGWMEEMLQLCQLDDVGVVGAMLYYPDDTVQHAGVVVGLGGYAGHSHKYAYKGRSGYMFRQACVQELSAVTGAAMMVKREAFDKVTGFDQSFAVAYNDVDLCLRIREKGYSVLFTPYAELYHHESKSRGDDEEGPNRARFQKEQALLKERYGEELLKDPFYSPWLTLDREDFSESEVLPESLIIPSGGGGES